MKGKRMLLRVLCMALILCLSCGALAEDNGYFGRGTDMEAYRALLQKGIMNVGNTLRIKRFMEKARKGEAVTVAAIGGSITEGAGAAVYKECYAYRFMQGLRARYGAGDGTNIHFVNAGVGGTPSTFGLMRFDRDVTERVHDDDGLADLVVIEFAVNDWGEPTKHRAYESLVKKVLQQPNAPAVILLFAVFENGFNLQDELKKVGETYGLMMVSVKDAVYDQVGKTWTKQEFFHDEYHPTSLGHGIMADCLLAAVEAAEQEETAKEDIALDVPPAYGTDYMGLVTVYGDTQEPPFVIDRGGFLHDDTASYRNQPVGRVCGENFCHRAEDPAAPLTFTATFNKLLIAWRATNGNQFGTAEIAVDGKVRQKLAGAPDQWGQSEVVMIWDGKPGTGAEHTVEIRMAEGSENKWFTVTAIGVGNE